MDTQIGLVKTLLGSASIILKDGSKQSLQQGDKLWPDSVIVTEGNSAIELEFFDGGIVDLGQNSQVILDLAVFNPSQSGDDQAAAEAESDVAALQQALLDGDDLSQLADATAASSGLIDESGGFGEVTIAHLAPEVEVTSGFDSTLNNEAAIIDDYQQQQELLTPSEAFSGEANKQPNSSDVGSAPQVQGSISLNGNLTTTVDYWQFNHNGGKFIVDMLTEISGPWNQNGVNGVNYQELDGDNVQTPLDVMIRVFSLNADGSRGAQVGFNDDNNQFGYDGSLYNRDSYLAINNLPAGEYQLVVGAWNLKPAEVDSGINDVDASNWHFTGPYRFALYGENGVQLKEQSMAFEAIDGNTFYENDLPAVSDVDVADSHEYFLIGGSEAVSLSNTSGAAIAIPTVTVDRQGHYSIDGDFNSLALGETATVSFQYYADDGKGFDGSDGFNESSRSEPSTVTITIYGTYDINVTAGDDLIIGDQGNNILMGAAGNDILTGGLGNDTFVWTVADLGSTTNPAHDQITDFSSNNTNASAAATDILDLSDLVGNGYSIEGLAAPNSQGSGKHLLLSIKDSGNQQVQTIDLNNIATSNDANAATILSVLLANGAIDDGI